MPEIIQETIEDLISRLLEIVEDIVTTDEKYQAELEQVHPEYLKSARNLIHYLVFRQYDLHEIQEQLRILGVSSLTNAEAHVMPSLRSVLRILYKFAEGKKLKLKDKSKKFIYAEETFDKNTEDLLGPKRDERDTRIMVTLPTEAAYNYDLILKLIQSGANSLRINCAHDDKSIWAKMIRNIRKAKTETGLDCRINMDLSGPKLRTGSIVPGPEVIRIRPSKDKLGNVIKPAECLMGEMFDNEYLTIPVSKKIIMLAAAGDVLQLRDARDRKRKFLVLNKKDDIIRVSTTTTTFFVSGQQITLLNSFGEFKEKGVIGKIPAMEESIFLKKGEILELHKSSNPGSSVILNEDGTVSKNAHISVTLEEVFRDVKKGERILFDDGKIESRVESVGKNKIKTRITYAGLKGTRLRTDKGMNLPDSTLNLSGLTEKDHTDLKFVVQNADVVNMSFVNSQEDVSDLQKALKKQGSEKVGIILKIETQRGYQNLSGILLHAMRSYPIGVMIARGDLAVECGWQNLAEIQEEILKMCAAARIPDVWATQVLETLAKKGRPSRAEITDAAMAQRADCIMLNKGPYILEAVKMLDQIVRKLEVQADKYKPTLPEIRIPKKEKLMKKKKGSDGE